MRTYIFLDTRLHLHMYTHIKFTNVRVWMWTSNTYVYQYVNCVIHWVCNNAKTSTRYFAITILEKKVANMLTDSIYTRYLSHHLSVHSHQKLRTETFNETLTVVTTIVPIRHPERCWPQQVMDIFYLCNTLNIIFGALGVPYGMVPTADVHFSRWPSMTLAARTPCVSWRWYIDILQQ